MPTGFINSDKDFRKLSAAELLAAEEEVRKNRKAERLKRLVQIAPNSEGSIVLRKARGTAGSAIDQLVNDYIARVKAAGGVVEAVNCLRATLKALP
jgi:hypothetical protein